jgi:hypothetical protein
MLLLLLLRRRRRRRLLRLPMVKAVGKLCGMSSTHGALGNDCSVDGTAPK